MTNMENGLPLQAGCASKTPDLGKSEADFEAELEAADKALIAAETERLHRFYAALVREMQRHLDRGGKEYEFWQKHELLAAHFESGETGYNHVWRDLKLWEKKAA